jgi:hypothetical protein
VHAFIIEIVVVIHRMIMLSTGRICWKTSKISAECHPMYVGKVIYK